MAEFADPLTAAQIRDRMAATQIGFVARCQWRIRNTNVVPNTHTPVVEWFGPVTERVAAVAANAENNVVAVRPSLTIRWEVAPYNPVVRDHVFPPVPQVGTEIDIMEFLTRAPIVIVPFPEGFGIDRTAALVTAGIPQVLAAVLVAGGIDTMELVAGIQEADFAALGIHLIPQKILLRKFRSVDIAGAVPLVVPSPERKDKLLGVVPLPEPTEFSPMDIRSYPLFQGSVEQLEAFLKRDVFFADSVGKADRKKRFENLLRWSAGVRNINLTAPTSKSLLDGVAVAWHELRCVIASEDFPGLSADLLFANVKHLVPWNTVEFDKLLLEARNKLPVKPKTVVLDKDGSGSYSEKECTHCKKRGHFVATCFLKHPHLKPMPPTTVAPKKGVPPVAPHA